MKMKKCSLIPVLVIICILLFSGNVHAQRYLPGQKAIQITGGVTDGDWTFASYHTGIAYSTYTRSGNRWLFGAELLSSESSVNNFKLPISQITGEAGYYFNFLSDRNKNLFFSLGFSALSGYETVNWGNKTLSDGSLITDRDRFIYGGAVSFEIEAYLTDRIALLLNVKERSLWGSDIGTFHNQIGVGIKYVLK